MSASHHTSGTDLDMTFTEEPVVFTVPLKDMTVTEQDEVTMECSINKPDREVTWFKDGQEVSVDARIKVRAFS